MSAFGRAAAVLLRAACPIMIAVAFSGCLYYQNGATQDMQFESTPAGARVVVNGIQHGATPTTVTLSRCQEYNVSVQKPGYTPATVLVSRTVSGPDTLLGMVDGLLIVPAIVDLWNCSSITLKPNPITVELTASSQSDPAATGAQAPSSGQTSQK